MASNPPFGGSADDQAQWAHDNINSEFSVDAWKAQGGMDSSCPPDYPYRSKRDGGDNACVEHPDNCPWGKTLHGSKCIPWDQANQMFGGGYGPSAQDMGAPGAPPNPWGGQQQSPLEKFQAQLQASLGTGTPAPGGTTNIDGQGWTGRPSMPDLNRFMAQSSTLPTQSATQGLLNQTTTQRPSQGVPGALGTGWSGGQGGLTQMMAQQQRKKAQNGSWWV